jgi:hypothetical protein
LFELAYFYHIFAKLLKDWASFYSSSLYCMRWLLLIPPWFPIIGGLPKFPPIKI